MKKVLRNIVLVVIAVSVFAPGGVFAAKKESRSGFSFWKPWTYFWRNNNKDKASKEDNKEDSVVVTESVDTEGESIVESEGDTNVDTLKEDNSIYLYDSDKSGKVQKVIDDEFIGEYKPSKEYKEKMRKHNKVSRNFSINFFDESNSLVAASLKINNDYTGSFGIGGNRDKHFKIERQGGNIYIQMLSERGEKLKYRYPLKARKVGDRFIIVFDDICWEKSGVYGISMECTDRGELGDLSGEFLVQVPHIGCPTKGEEKINAYFNRVLYKEYDELRYIREKVRMYEYASTSYEVKYKKNDIVSVFREREINGGPGMRGRTSYISYKSFAEVFDRTKGTKLEITDVLSGSRADIDRFILDCYRGLSKDKNSVRVEFGFVEGNVECNDRDIVNGVSFHVDDSDLVFVLDVFDGSRLEIGKAICKVNIEENKNLFTQEFLKSYNG